MMVPIEPQQLQIAVNSHLLVLIGSQPISLNQSTEVGIRSHGLSFECQYIGYTDVEAVQPRPKSELQSHWNTLLGIPSGVIRFIHLSGKL
jgi:hypothetical protein